MSQQANRISISAMKGFLSCPKKYYFDNVARIERKRKRVGFAFGTAVHEGMEPVWSNGPDQFATAWEKFKDDDTIDYKGDNLYSKENWNTYLERGHGMMAALKAYLAKNKIKNLDHLEVSDNVPVDDFVVSRRLDVVANIDFPDALVDGVQKRITGRSIIDLKTAGRMYPTLAALRSLQLSGYSLPLSQDKGKKKLEVQYAGFLVVTKAKVPRVEFVATPVTPKTQQEFLRTAKAVMTYIRTGKFPMNKGDQCGWCDFREICFEAKNAHDLYKEREKRKDKAIDDEKKDDEQ